VLDQVVADTHRFRSGEDACNVERPASDVGNLSVAPTTTEPATMPINERRSIIPGRRQRNPGHGPGEK
jgi:hypothetical protein